MLAGDHLKAASDLGVPLVGIGLFYRHGYFRQSLSTDGWQQERYPDLDPHAMALAPCDGMRVEVDLAGTPLVARIWKAEVGRIPLYLLDADVDENPPELRGHHRPALRRRHRAPPAPGDPPRHRRRAGPRRPRHRRPGVPHQRGPRRLPRPRAHPPARRRTRASPTARPSRPCGPACIFTTHTPVPAGIDRFPRELIEQLLQRAGRAEVGITLDELMALGHRPGDTPDERFNMAVMGLRLAGRSNAVAKLHGEVSREMFSDLWPDVPVEEVPITSVTNGVHAHTWVAPEMADLLDAPRAARVARGRGRPLGAPRPRPATTSCGEPASRAARRLVAFVRQRLRDQLMARGPVVERRRVDRLGARPEGAHHRLRPPLRHLQAGHAAALAARPAQARCCCRATGRCSSCSPASPTPPTTPARSSSARSAPSPPTRRCATASCSSTTTTSPWPARCCQGADVWLNNPRRPQEACGTSGMKAALNGGLNLSILDGWWDECFDGDNGWAISSAEHLDDLERRDEVEAGSLFELLERQVVPLFYERWQGPVPRRGCSA